ncbi:MAG: hypothetical protein SFZ24_11290 [Planctomycetota bacterium]|nr:hypothetical protein [Planctomycetota bacterium]
MSRLAKLMSLHGADPGDADVLYMIAQEHAKAGAQAEAVRWYDRCLGASPEYHYAYFHKARSQQAAGDVAGAAATAAQGLKRAVAAGNAKAASELAALVDELEG